MKKLALNIKSVIKKNLARLLVSLLIMTLFVVVVFPMMYADAGMELIYEKNNPELEFKHFNGQFNSNVWDSSAEGKLEGTPGDWSLKSNGWAQWSGKDNLDFGFERVKFNYTDKAVMTVETTMTSFNGRTANAGAGLMVRAGLNDTSPCAFIHFRPGFKMITYRLTEADDAKQGKTEVGTTAGDYPVTFRMVYTKGQTQLRCYYSIKGGPFVELGSVQFVAGDEIYAGIACYSQEEEFTATAKFNNFNVKVEGPDGWSELEENTSSTTSKPEEETIVLPEDLPPAEDVLLRETFTDGSMDAGQEDITNPLWEIKDNNKPVIEINENNTNRYLNEFMMEHSYYFAGSTKWADYSISMDVDFTNGWSESEENRFVIYMRHTNIKQYFAYDYTVTFLQNTANQKQTVHIGYRQGARDLGQDDKAIASTVKEFNYLKKTGYKCNIRVDVFDNTIAVFVDNVLITSWTDTGSVICGKGNIGFGSNKAAVLVDNITVIKLKDLLGGDYDNTIAGNWDKEPPAYLKEWPDKDIPR